MFWNTKCIITHEISHGHPAREPNEKSSWTRVHFKYKLAQASCSRTYSLAPLATRSPPSISIAYNSLSLQSGKGHSLSIIRIINRLRHLSMSFFNQKLRQALSRRSFSNYVPRGCVAVQVGSVESSCNGLLLEPPAL